MQRSPRIGTQGENPGMRARRQIPEIVRRYAVPGHGQPGGGRGEGFLTPERTVRRGQGHDRFHRAAGDVRCCVQVPPPQAGTQASFASSRVPDVSRQSLSPRKVLSWGPSCLTRFRPGAFAGVMTVDESGVTGEPDYPTFVLENTRSASATLQAWAKARTSAVSSNRAISTVPEA